MSYVPTQGVDTFTENELKTDGSVLSYGQSTSAADYGVSSATLRCSGAAEEVYDGLNATERARAAVAEEYLLALCD